VFLPVVLPFDMFIIVINKKVITTFKHKREDGLADCLRRAAEAVDEEREKFVMEIMKK